MKNATKIATALFHNKAFKFIYNLLLIIVAIYGILAIAVGVILLIQTLLNN
jgi:hypothetical protein